MIPPVTTEIIQAYFLTETVTGFSYHAEFLIVATDVAVYHISEDGSIINKIKDL